MDEVLYESRNVRVTYLHSPEPGKEDEVISGEEHELWIGDNRYVLQRGILRELYGSVERNDVVELVRLLNVINLGGLERMQTGVNLPDVGSAVRGAYEREEELRDEWISRHNSGVE